MARLTTNDYSPRFEQIASPIELGNSRFVQPLDGTSPDLNVDGSGTQVVFEYNSGQNIDTTLDFELLEFKIQFEDDKFEVDGFMGINNPLTNGLLIEIKSNDVVFQYEPVRANRDFELKLAFGRGSKVEVTTSNNANYLTVSSLNPVVLKRSGSFTTDDYFRLIVRDNLSGIRSGECVILGVEREVI